MNTDKKTPEEIFLKHAMHPLSNKWAYEQVFLRSMEEYGQQEETTGYERGLAEKRNAEAIVKMISDWSKKYPRGRIYGISNMKMDDELVEIEEVAKAYFSSDSYRPEVWRYIDKGQIPEEGQLVIFEAQTRDEYYNGKIYGGHYSNRKGLINEHDFVMPGLVLGANKWFPVNVPAPPQQGKEEENGN